MNSFYVKILFCHTVDNTILLVIFPFIQDYIRNNILQRAHSMFKFLELLRASGGSTYETKI